MPAEMNLNNAEIEPVLDDHPWGGGIPEPWRRAAYDLLVRQAWPLVIRPLVGHGSDRRAYLPARVERRLRPVAEHLAYVVPLAEQEAFLPATVNWPGQGPSAEPTIPLDSRDLRVGAERSAAKGLEMREQFADALARMPLTAFACQSEYDLTLGMPRRMERHSLELRNGSRFWSHHLAARRTIAPATANR